MNFRKLISHSHRLSVLWIQRRTMESNLKAKEYQQLREGSADFFLPKNVFYNPVQEFNRDMSVLVLDTYIEHELWNRAKKSKRVVKHNFKVLDALSASGLRCIRYANEVTGASKIAKFVSNDYSQDAVDVIAKNIEHNGLSDRIEITNQDATTLMYNNRDFEKRFIGIDVDPYGCAGLFLDGAVQALLDGGILMVTATDVAILCGNNAETCFAKYGSVSLRVAACHEMALRILLRSIESAAIRYGRYIRPLLSLSVDFYVRIFVQIFTSPLEAKKSASRTAMVYNCHGCHSFHTQRLGRVEQVGNKDKNNFKHSFATGPPTDSHCSNCGSKFHVGGPIWADRLHDLEFVKLVQERLEKSVYKPEEELSSFGTYKRMKGILQVVSEELPDELLFYTPGQFCRILKCITPTFPALRSAILNAGYQVSYSHTNPISLKTDAPNDVLWEIMLKWYQICQQSGNEYETANKTIQEEENEKDGNDATKPESRCKQIRKQILSRSITREISFELNEKEPPQSRTQQLVRYQMNPTKNWGPKPRSKPLVEEDTTQDKRTRNQGKRKLKEFKEQPKKIIKEE